MTSENQIKVSVSPRKCNSYQPPPTVTIIESSKPVTEGQPVTTNVNGRLGAISRQRSQSVKHPRYAGQTHSMKQRGASPTPSQPKYSIWTVMGAPPHISPNLHRNASMCEDNADIGFPRRNTRSGSYAAFGEMDEQERMRLKVLRAGMEDGVVKKLRNFSIDPVNGLINEGDAYRCTGIQSDHKENSSPKRFNVAVIGAPGVGKDTLVQHFANVDQNSSVELDSTDLTESVESASTSSRIYSNDRTKIITNKDRTIVSILLDGEEYELNIVKKSMHRGKIDTDYSEAINAYIFVYSIDKDDSYKECLTAIDDLRAWEAKHHTKQAFRPVIILVGNKSDLERRRVVHSNDAKIAAKRRDCKFIEVSVAIGHNIDRLLIGALTHVKNATGRRPSAKKTSGDSLTPYGKQHDDAIGDEGVKKSCTGELTTILSDEQYDYRPRDEEHVGDEENLHKNLLKAKKSVVKGTKSTGYGSSFTAARRQIMNRISFKKKKMSKSVEDLFFE